MKTTPMCLLTVIAEEVAAEPLLAEFRAAGAKGFTSMRVQGQGLHRSRTTEWEGENIRIEVLCSEPVAAVILSRLEEAYFSEYAITVFASTVDVVRPGKYA